LKLWSLVSQLLQEYDMSCGRPARSRTGEHESRLYSSWAGCSARGSPCCTTTPVFQKRCRATRRQLLATVVNRCYTRLAPSLHRPVRPSVKPLPRPLLHYSTGLQARVSTFHHRWRRQGALGRVPLLDFQQFILFHSTLMELLKI